VILPARGDKEGSSCWPLRKRSGGLKRVTLDEPAAPPSAVKMQFLPVAEKLPIVAFTGIPPTKTAKPRPMRCGASSTGRCRRTTADAAELGTALKGDVAGAGQRPRWPKIKKLIQAPAGSGCFWRSSSKPARSAWLSHQGWGWLAAAPATGHAQLHMKRRRSRPLHPHRQTMAASSTT